MGGVCHFEGCRSLVAVRVAYPCRDDEPVSRAAADKTMAAGVGDVQSDGMYDVASSIDGLARQRGEHKDRVDRVSEVPIPSLNHERLLCQPNSSEPRLAQCGLT